MTHTRPKKCKKERMSHSVSGWAHCPSVIGDFLRESNTMLHHTSTRERKEDEIKVKKKSIDVQCFKIRSGSKKCIVTINDCS